MKKETLISSDSVIAKIFVVVATKKMTKKEIKRFGIWKWWKDHKILLIFRRAQRETLCLSK